MNVDTTMQTRLVRSLAVSECRAARKCRSADQSTFDVQCSMFAIDTRRWMLEFRASERRFSNIRAKVACETRNFCAPKRRRHQLAAAFCACWATRTHVLRGPSSARHRGRPRRHRNTYDGLVSGHGDRLSRPQVALRCQCCCCYARTKRH